MLVGAVTGLLVGAVGFFVLAPAEGGAADEEFSGSSVSGAAGVTVTTSPGAGGTDGQDAVEGSAATPEEQAIFDLAAAFDDEDCASIVAQSAGLWSELFDSVASDDATAINDCEAGFASAELGPVRVYQTWIVTSTAESTQVAAVTSGWLPNLFFLREEESGWTIYSGMYSSDVAESGSAQPERGSESGGRLGDRQLTDPDDPPSGNPTFDGLAANCHTGSMVACDDLYWVAPRYSEYELYGVTCGGRRLGVFAGGLCERDFNRQLD